MNLFRRNKKPFYPLSITFSLSYTKAANPYWRSSYPMLDSRIEIPDSTLAELFEIPENVKDIFLNFSIKYLGPESYLAQVQKDSWGRCRGLKLYLANGRQFIANISPSHTRMLECLYGRRVFYAGVDYWEPEKSPDFTVCVDLSPISVPK